MADNVVKSRYEIINDLVAKKTGIIDEVAELEKGVQTNLANLEQRKRQYQISFCHLRNTDKKFLDHQTLGYKLCMIL